MDNRTIFTKTAKGLGESIGKTKALSRDARKVIVEVNGVASVKDLLAKLENFSEDKLSEILGKLKAGDYIHEFHPPSVSGDDESQLPVEAQLDDALTALTIGAYLREVELSSQEIRNTQNTRGSEPTGLDPLLANTAADARDAKADLASDGSVKAKKPEARSKKEAVEKRQREADAKEKKAAEELRRQEEMQKEKLQQKETEDKAWRKFEAKAKEQAEALARQKAGEQAIKEAGEKEKKAKKEAEELARKQEKAQKEKEAEDKAWRKFEAKAKKAAEEKAQREAEKTEVLARQAMEEQARKERGELEQVKKKEAEELARQELQLQEKKAEEERLQRELEKIAEEFSRLGREEQARKELEDARKKETEELARLEAQLREAQEKEAAQEKARQELELKNKKEAAELARQKAQEEKEQAELLAQQKAAEEKAAEELALLASQEKARLDAENAQARQLAEQVKAQAYAEQSAREEAERQARLQAETLARQELDLRQQGAAQEIADKLEQLASETISEQANAAELAAQKAQEQARLNAIARDKEKAKQEAAALAREKIAAKNQQKIEQKKQREAERKARKHADETAPAATGHVYGSSRSWGMSLLGICFLVIVALLAWSQLNSFEEKIVLFEKTASEQLQQKVKIDRMRFSFVPQPQWQLEGVVIGSQGQIKIHQVNAILDLTALSEQTEVFKSIEFLSPVLNEEGLGWLLFGRSQKTGMRVNQVSASNAKFDTPNFNLGDVDIDAEIGTGNVWKKMTVQSATRELTIELQAKDELVQMKANAKTLALPFGSTMRLSTFSAEGVLERNAVALSKFYGVIYQGTLSGSARLSWDKNGAGDRLGDRAWLLKGDVKARQIDLAQWLPEVFQGGELEGNGKFIMQARDSNKLFSTQRLNGNFVARKGTLHGLDLVKLLQGHDSAGTSSFNEMSGWFSYEAGRDNGHVKVGNVKLTAGLVSANGNVEVGNKQELNGRFAVELDTPARNARADLLVSGHLNKPHFDSTPTASR